MLEVSLEKFQNLSAAERVDAYFPEEELQKIPIRDNDEKLVDIEDFFLKSQAKIIIDLVGGERYKAKLRKGAAERLVRASRKLDHGYVIKLTDAHRPIWLQRKVFDEVCDEIKGKNPELSTDPKKLYYEVTKYVADPDGCPPHSTGGTVDLTLANSSEEEIDMGVPINTVTKEAHTFAENIPKKVQRKRKVLFDAMTKNGFVNLSTEWWHYSYGDQYWAAFYKKPFAIYGKIEENR
jgi:zinc D-Ala-D-Ala dipeptidase